MVKRPCFERGDIVLVGFEPANGHEQKGAGRPALVLSVSAFNRLGMTLVAPVTQGGNFARYAGFSVSGIRQTQKSPDVRGLHYQQ